jgi:OmpA-OmpF porin, OOP family
MHATMIRVSLALALVAAAAGLRSAHAQDFLNQEWLLNPSLSNVYMETVKANSIFEAHHFTAVEGGVSKDGDATVKIELASLETGVDIRNVRMRFLLFETYKFPYAEISAKLDKAKLQALATNNRVVYPLVLKVSMHGIVNEIQTQVWVTRINDTTVSVAAVKPIIVTAESFGLTPNVAKLVEVIGGTPIATAASITFDLVFGTGNLKPDLEAARATREKSRAEQAAQTISAEGCETRFSVISQTGAIYFKTGSAELDRESEPLLNSGADIANRCPSVKFEVEGHTDNVGGKRSNQTLSEQRAKSVVDYLMEKGISAARIQSAGYGDTRPVASNDTEANRAKNRRIEFKVKKN